MSSSSSVHRRVLIVDDAHDIHADFNKLLRGDDQADAALEMARKAFFQEAERAPAAAPKYQIDSAYQGAEALELVKRQHGEGDPYALAFVDSRMPPGWDGIETVRRLWEVDPELLIVICTAYSDYTWEQMADLLTSSNSFLVLKKPFESVEVRQMAAALTTRWELARQVESQAKEIVSVRDVTVFALAQLADSRDPETGDHLCRMRAYAQQLAVDLHRAGKFPEEISDAFLDDLYRASPLHDIGKVGIPDLILLKPGKLTPAEFEVMKRHTVIGAETLQRAASRTLHGGFLEMAINVARSHHERFDGKGYPDGLLGQQIPLAARIVSVADVYDALTSTRVYKAAMAPAEARTIIREQAGKQFDPEIVEAFERCYDAFLQVPVEVCEAEAEFVRLEAVELSAGAAASQAGDSAVVCA